MFDEICESLVIFSLQNFIRVITDAVIIFRHVAFNAVALHAFAFYIVEFFTALTAAIVITAYFAACITDLFTFFFDYKNFVNKSSSVLTKTFITKTFILDTNINESTTTTSQINVMALT